jgi:hypothetical protein
VTTIVRFENAAGTPVLVEVDDDAFGVEHVSHSGAVVEAGRDLQDVFDGIRPTLKALTAALKDLAPDRHEVEFGMKLNAEAGVIVAKTAVEGHFTVKLSWAREGS